MNCQELSSRFDATQDKALAIQLFRHHMRRDEPMSALGLLSHLDAASITALSGLALCTLARFAYLGALPEAAALIEQAVKAKLKADPGPEQSWLVELYLTSARLKLDLVDAWPAIDALIKAANGRLRSRTLDRDCVLSIIKAAKVERFAHSGVERVANSYRYPFNSAGCIAGRRAGQRSLYVGIAQATGRCRVTPWQPWRGVFDYVFADPSDASERRQNARSVDIWTKRHDAQPYANVLRIKHLRRRA